MYGAHRKWRGRVAGCHACPVMECICICNRRVHVSSPCKIKSLLCLHTSLFPSPQRFWMRWMGTTMGGTPPRRDMDGMNGVVGAYSGYFVLCVGYYTGCGVLVTATLTTTQPTPAPNPPPTAHPTTHHTLHTHDHPISPLPRPWLPSAPSPPLTPRTPMFLTLTVPERRHQTGGAGGGGGRGGAGAGR